MTDEKEKKPDNWLDRYPVYLDAIKGVGTGNGAGLFGAGVAFYYFAMREAHILRAIKWAAFLYLLGVAIFSIAYCSLIISRITHDSQDEDLRVASKSSWHVAYWGALLSFLVWWIATAFAAYVIGQL